MTTEDGRGHLPLTLFFADVHASDTSIVGGKGANLAVLTRAGVPVPPGFCTTTRAFQLFIGQLPDSDARFLRCQVIEKESPPTRCRGRVPRRA